MRSTASIALLAVAGMALSFAAGLGLSPSTGPDSWRQPLPMTCVAPARPFVRSELLFGTTMKDGGAVGEQDWLAFLDGVVTPRFPEGLTVLTGVGQWRTAQGRIIRETARMLLIWHVPGPLTETHIAAVRDTYRRQFGQDSVMRVGSISCVTF